MYLLHMMGANDRQHHAERAVRASAGDPVVVDHVRVRQQAHARAGSLEAGAAVRMDGAGIVVEQAGVGEDKLTGDLRRGLLLGFANPQLLLFWCGVLLMVVSWGMDGSSVLELLGFATGAFVGAIVLLMILVRMGVKAQERLTPTGLRRLFRGIGVVLVLSGGYALLRSQGWVP